MTISNNKTSLLISSQVPQFVKDDHETFVLFLQDYYKFLEQNGQVGNVSKNFTKYKDADIAEGEFLQKLYDNFIKLLPENIVADKTLILKHVKDFYRARGSEKSVRFLMRILLNKEIEFYYPKRDILRASDGKWFIEKSVKISDIKVNNTSNTIAYSNFVNKKITGLSSGATAIVESVDTFYDKGEHVTELKLSNEYRSFLNGETVECMFTEESIDKYLSGNLFSGVVVAVSLVEGGSGYTEGASVPVEGGGGTGAQVIISSTTKGSISSIGVMNGGAGFRVDDSLIITGGGGVDASSNVSSVDLSEKYHPNTYNLVKSTINLEAGTPINNVRYSNLNSSIVNPYSDSVQNSMSYWTFANCGPVATCLVLNTGDHYVSSPSIDIQSNTVVRALGILGRMEILDGGLNYNVGDELAFTNPMGCYGVGAKANVSAVAANGMITEVKFREMPGHTIGGSGYEQLALPLVSVTSGTGNGASIAVKAILGDGETVAASAVTYGKILELKLVTGGSGYTTTPTLNLSNMAMGTGAVATASIVTGAYTYPGRFLNDDGFVSAYNFLEDRDYYQNFSYVIRVDESTNKYRKAIKDLTHPAGMKLFGHYLLTDQNKINVSPNVVSWTANNKLLQSNYTVVLSDVTKSGTYNVNSLTASYTPKIIPGTYSVTSSETASFTSAGTDMILYSPDHGLFKNSNVYLKFHTAIYSNITNGLYSIKSANANYITVPIANSNSAFYSPPTISSNLVAATGYGLTNNYVSLSQVLKNSNVVISLGDSLTINGSQVKVVSTNVDSSVVIVSPALTGNLTNKSIAVSKKAYTANGNVSIFDPVMTVYANTTGLVTGDNAYIKFASNDTSLQNTRYEVLFANSTMLRVTHKNIASATSLSGAANVHTNVLTLTSNYHGLDDNESVFIYFYSGDTGNATNSLYTVSGVTQNTFNVVTTYPVTAAGSAYAKTANITLNITDHGFNTNDPVRVWFTSGDTANISNGVYYVNKRSSSQVFFDTPAILTTNGTVTVYRGYANVNIYRQSHGRNVGDVIDVLFDSGNVESIANGVFAVDAVANTNQYSIKHTGVVVSSNLSNLLPNNTGYVYTSLHKY